MDQFAHISLGHQTSSSVLMHHLSARLVHGLRGVTPHATLPLCRMVWWVFQVWVLYNDFVRRIGLHQLAVGEQLLIATAFPAGSLCSNYYIYVCLAPFAGVRHFIQCPVEADKPDAVSRYVYMYLGILLVYSIRLNIGRALVWWIVKILQYVDLVLAVKDCSYDSFYT